MFTVESQWQHTSYPPFCTDCTYLPCSPYTHLEYRDTAHNTSHYFESVSTWCDSCWFGTLQQAILIFIEKYLGMGGGAESCCGKISSSLEGFWLFSFQKQLQKNPSHSIKMFWWEQMGRTSYWKVLVRKHHKNSIVETLGIDSRCKFTSPVLCGRKKSFLLFLYQTLLKMQLHSSKFTLSWDYNIIARIIRRIVGWWCRFWRIKGIEIARQRQKQSMCVNRL